MLGDDLRAVGGATVGSWIEPALGESGAVEDQVPKLFEAYARVFHPARDAEGAGVTWAEVARRLGRIAHPGMQSVLARAPATGPPAADSVTQRNVARLTWLVRHAEGVPSNLDSLRGLLGLGGDLRASDCGTAPWATRSLLRR
jgi:hypothetical protein